MVTHCCHCATHSSSLPFSDFVSSWKIYNYCGAQRRHIQQNGVLAPLADHSFQLLFLLASTPTNHQTPAEIMDHHFAIFPFR